MKKFIYFCGMILLSLNMMAQIDPYDRNWDTIVNEDFSTPARTWIHETFTSSDGLWRAYPGHGVTHNDDLMDYQYSQCHFNDNDQTMELVAVFDSTHRIPIHNYALPLWMYPSYGGSGFPTNDSLFYFSGAIDYIKGERKDKGIFRYGYYEIRCRLPIHQGAFPAFWLWHADDTISDPHYEEIDIFEYSWRFEDSVSLIHYSANPHGAGYPFCFTSGIYYNDTSTYCGYETSRARVFPMINDSLNHWHTFACEWLPEHVIWYCDGQVVNEFYDMSQIPHHRLTLKTNYAIDFYALKDHVFGNDPQWRGTDTMFIDYINVYQLNCQCDKKEEITRQYDLEQFDFGVKKSIEISSSVGPVSIGSNEKVTFRAVDSFIISGPFQVDNGGELTVIIQSCPNR